jgi:hypothetical protein
MHTESSNSQTHMHGVAQIEKTPHVPRAASHLLPDLSPPLEPHGRSPVPDHNSSAFPVRKKPLAAFGRRPSPSTPPRRGPRESAGMSRPLHPIMLPTHSGAVGPLLTPLVAAPYIRLPAAPASGGGGLSRLPSVRTSHPPVAIPRRSPCRFGLWRWRSQPDTLW